MMTMADLDELEKDIAETPDDQQVKLWAGTARELLARGKAWEMLMEEHRECGSYCVVRQEIDEFEAASANGFRK
jgi:hypothetical protein